MPLGGSHALVSHRAAGRLWDLDGVTATRMEITVPKEVRVRSQKLVVHRTTDTLPADRTRLGPISVTTPLRTLIDVSACLESDALELAVEDAFRRGLTTPKQLAWRLDGLGDKGRSGCAELRRLLRGIAAQRKAAGKYGSNGSWCAPDCRARVASTKFETVASLSRGWISPIPATESRSSTTDCAGTPVGHRWTAMRLATSHCCRSVGEYCTSRKRQ